MRYSRSTHVVQSRERKIKLENGNAPLNSLISDHSQRSSIIIITTTALPSLRASYAGTVLYRRDTHTHIPNRRCFTVTQPSTHTHTPFPETYLSRIPPYPLHPPFLGKINKQRTPIPTTHTHTHTQQSPTLTPSQPNEKQRK